VVTKAFEEAMLERRKFGMCVQIGGFRNPSIPNTFIVLTQDDFEDLVRLAEIGRSKEDDQNG
jgi:acyl CoA:acetate/3-ketoacid CoA transferase alpha subunit